MRMPFESLCNWALSGAGTGRGPLAPGLFNVDPQRADVIGGKKTQKFGRQDAGKLLNAGVGDRQKNNFVGGEHIVTLAEIDVHAGTLGANLHFRVLGRQQDMLVPAVQMGLDGFFKNIEIDEEALFIQQLFFFGNVQVHADLIVVSMQFFRGFLVENQEMGG